MTEFGARHRMVSTVSETLISYIEGHNYRTRGVESGVVYDS